MKKFKKSRMIAITILLIAALMSAQCGYILHPERKGTKSGDIDVPILIMDVAWLVFFVVPGVVALVVDFYTGCIYDSGGLVQANPGTVLEVRVRDKAPTDANMSVSIEKDGAQVVSLMDRDFVKGEQVDSLSLAIPSDLATGEYQLTVAVNGVTSAQWDLQIVQ